MSEDPLADLQAIRWLLDRLDRSWRDGDEASLRRCFHLDAVLAGPKHQVLAGGVDACVGSYLDFLRAATIHAYQRGEPEIRVWENSAVASYAWTMDYEIDSGRSREEGEDLLVLERMPAGWLVVWRGLASRPAGA